jgi:hypothetical protein
VGEAEPSRDEAAAAEAWEARFARRVLRYQRDPAQVTGDAIFATATATAGELATLGLFVILLVGLPLVAVAIGVDSFGDKWAFVVALVTWPVVLSLYGARARRLVQAEAEQTIVASGRSLFVSQLVFFLAAVGGLLGFALLSRLVHDDDFYAVSVLRGFFWGAAIGSGVVAARDGVAFSLALQHGAPIYAARPDPGEGRLPKPPPPGHALVRSFLTVIGLAAIGFSCVILTWPGPFSASTDSTTTTTTSPANPPSGGRAGARAQKSTTVTAQSHSSPSNALVGGVLGAGVLLLVAAALFDRLQELKGPGGVGLVLAAPTPSEEEKQKIAELVPEALREKGLDPTPELVARATVNSLAAAQSQLWPAGGVRADLDPEKIVVTTLGPAVPGQTRSLVRTHLDDADLRAAVEQALDREPL